MNFSSITLAKIKDTAAKAAAVFAVAFSGAFVLPALASWGSVSAWEAAAIAAASSGLVAVLNAFKNSSPSPKVQLAQLAALAPKAGK